MFNHTNSIIEKEKPSVSIIIVTYNNIAVIESCLLALREQSYKNFDTIIVDNDSVDTTISMVANFPEVKLIQAKKNLGFAGGNILGLSHAHGELVVLLNPDTEPCAMWLEALVKGMNVDNKIGLCASKLIVYGTDMIDSAGDGCMITGRGFKRGEGENTNLYSELDYVFGACGGAVMLRRELIDDIGFLDDDFFLIHEDTDLNFRAQLAGWKCLFVPSAVVYHKVRSSIGIMSDLAVYYSVRNARFVWVKNMPIGLMFKYLPHQIIQEIGAIIFFVIKHRKINAYLRATWDSIIMFPLIFKKRRFVMQKKRISNCQLETILTQLFQPKLFKQKVKKLLE